VNIVEGFDETKACLIDGDGNIVVAGFAHKSNSGSMFAFKLLNNSCPSYSISAEGPITFCQGGKVKLKVSPSSSSYQWNRNGVEIAGATSSTYTVKKSGDYYCTVSTDCGSIKTNTITVVVNINPKAKIAPSGTVTICEGQKIKLQANADVPLTYQWYQNGIAISGATQSSYKASADGSYTVITTNSQACTKQSPPTIVEITCKTETNVVDEIFISPNPSTGNLQINLSSHEFSTLTLTNLLGQEIFKSEIPSDESTLNFDFRNFEKGIYLVKLQSEDRTVVRKWILE
jgi:hypothetical protein